MSTLHVEDFVVLGRTVPEDSKKYGQRVCMAGYSPSCNQFLRVYPLMVPVGPNAGTNDFRARYTYHLDLTRNPKDNRMESWRVEDEMNPTRTPWAAATEVKKTAILDWLSTKKVPSIDALNTCRMSLGVLFVPADNWTGTAVEKEAPAPPEHHRSLFEDLEHQAVAEPAFGKVRYAPYIEFQDALSTHRLQVREWGAYRLLSNESYSDKPESLWTASGYRTGKDLWIVVGNMTNHRKNWMVIKTFEADAAKGPSLFDSLPTEDE
jgi:hypothetical protein